MTATPSFSSTRATTLRTEIAEAVSKPFDEWECGDGTKVLLAALKLNRALGEPLLEESIIKFCLEDAIPETEFDGTLSAFERALHKGATALMLMEYFQWCDELVLIARKYKAVFGDTELCDYVEERFASIVEAAPLYSLRLLAPRVSRWVVVNNALQQRGEFERGLSLILQAL